MAVLWQIIDQRFSVQGYNCLDRHPGNLSFGFSDEEVLWAYEAGRGTGGVMGFGIAPLVTTINCGVVSIAIQYD